MDVREEFFRLKEQSLRSSGEDRKRADEALDAFLAALSEEDRQTVCRAIDEDFTSLHRKADEARILADKISLRQQMKGVLPLISVSALSREYFGKSGSWFYQRLNGNVVHGKPCAFTEEELETLRFALQDISRKIGSLSV